MTGLIVDTVYSLSELEAHAKKAVRGAGFAWGYAEEAAKSIRLLAAHQLPGAVMLAAYLSERAEGDVFCGPVVTDAAWSVADAAQALCPVLSGAALCDFVQFESKIPSASSEQRLKSKTFESKGSAFPSDSRKSAGGSLPLIRPFCRNSALEEQGGLKAVGEGSDVVLAELAYPLLVLPYVALLSRRLDCALQVSWEGVELACHQGRLVRTAGDDTALMAVRAARFTCHSVAVADVGEEAGTRGQVISGEAWARLNAFAHHTYVPATEASRRGAGPA